jgi:hypothetical protein
MLRKTRGNVNICTCDLPDCGWTWKSLILPILCPHCRQRGWNGRKPIGRPKRQIPALKGNS